MHVLLKQMPMLEMVDWLLPMVQIMHGLCAENRTEAIPTKMTSAGNTGTWCINLSDLAHAVRLTFSHGGYAVCRPTETN